MGNSKVQKVRSPYPDMVTLDSRTLKRGEARARDMRESYPSLFASEPSERLGVLPGSAVERVRAISPLNPGKIITDGRRCYSSLDAMRKANPRMTVITNPAPGTGKDPGAKAERLSKAIGYSKYAHDLFGVIADVGAGKVAKRALVPVKYLLDVVDGGARYAASRQRGEPTDVAAIRAVSPIASGALGGAVAGAGTGAVLGSLAPGLGNAGGAIAGAVVGGYAAYETEKLGEKAAEDYARARKHGR